MSWALFCFCRSNSSDLRIDRTGGERFQNATVQVRTLGHRQVKLRDVTVLVSGARFQAQLFWFAVRPHCLRHHLEPSGGEHTMEQRALQDSSGLESVQRQAVHRLFK